MTAGPDRTLGQVCYEAYFTDADGMSLVTGDSLPSFGELLPRVRQAWEAGARAAAAAVTVPVRLTAPDAQPGDIVLDGSGAAYQAPDGQGAAGWSTMQIIPFFGPPEATAPAGELTLIARNGRPPCGS